MSEQKVTRCAVYTRKSTEHNLDMEFNSLDAQREACEAYIKSQKHEGWVLIPNRYDDGGISGGTLERPDLRRLLDDIKAQRVDTVVVYKVDRLTRSLGDFAKLVELFDAQGVSFVSVTQAFNTTTSMGRLTLNVLLSFAQFEREVIGERVRDKIAASKRKGLWMGGSVPLGYVSENKKLVIVPDEAELVRWIYQRYLQLGAIGPLLEDLDKSGIKTKSRTLKGERVVGGGRFGMGGLNHLLKNACYVGEIHHRGEIHPGCHEPILGRTLFEAVQEKLKANSVERKMKLKSSPFILTGLLFDSAGNRMSPTHTIKKGARYRYYISQAIAQRRKSEAGTVSRVPAPDIEDAISSFLRIKFVGSDLDLSLRQLVEAKVERITIRAEDLLVEFLPSEETNGAGLDAVAVTWQRRPFVALKGAIQGSPESAGASSEARAGVLAAIGKARIWVNEISTGTSFKEIARRERKGERQIRLLTSLAFVSPGTVQGLVEGSIRPLTVTELAKGVPLIWPSYAGA